MVAQVQQQPQIAEASTSAIPTRPAQQSPLTPVSFTESQLAVATADYYSFPSSPAPLPPTALPEGGDAAQSLKPIPAFLTSDRRTASAASDATAMPRGSGTETVPPTPPPKSPGYLHHQQQYNHRTQPDDVPPSPSSAALPASSSAGPSVPSSASADQVAAALLLGDQSAMTASSSSDIQQQRRPSATESTKSSKKSKRGELTLAPRIPTRASSHTFLRQDVPPEYSAEPTDPRSILGVSGVVPATAAQELAHAEPRGSRRPSVASTLSSSASAGTLRFQRGTPPATPPNMSRRPSRDSPAYEPPNNFFSDRRRSSGLSTGSTNMITDLRRGSAPAPPLKEETEAEAEAAARLNSPQGPSAAMEAYTMSPSRRQDPPQSTDAETSVPPTAANPNDSSFIMVDGQTFIVGDEDLSSASAAVVPPSASEQSTQLVPRSVDLSKRSKRAAARAAAAAAGPDGSNRPNAPETNEGDVPKYPSSKKKTAPRASSGRRTSDLFKTGLLDAVEPPAPVEPPKPTRSRFVDPDESSVFDDETDSSGDEQPPSGVYAIQPPTRAAMLEVSDLELWNEKGDLVRFGDIYAERRTVICFLRHWFCPMCQEYAISMGQLDPLPLKMANLGMAVVGQGHPHVIEAYKRVLGIPEWIDMYADPTRKIYKGLGMTMRTNDKGPACAKPDYITMGTFKASMAAIKKGLFDMPVRLPGDVKLLGGEFILGPGIECSFTHRMVTTRGHLDLPRILTQAGCDMTLKTAGSPEPSRLLMSRPASIHSTDQTPAESRKRIGSRALKKKDRNAMRSKSNLRDAVLPVEDAADETMDTVISKGSVQPAVLPRARPQSMVVFDAERPTPTPPRTPGTPSAQLAEAWEDAPESPMISAETDITGQTQRAETPLTSTDSEDRKAIEADLRAYQRRAFAEGPLNDSAGQGQRLTSLDSLNRMASKRSTDRAASGPGSSGHDSVRRSVSLKKRPTTAEEASPSTNAAAAAKSHTGHGGQNTPTAQRRLLLATALQNQNLRKSASTSDVAAQANLSQGRAVSPTADAAAISSVDSPPMSTLSPPAQEQQSRPTTPSSATKRDNGDRGSPLPSMVRHSPKNTPPPANAQEFANRALPPRPAGVPLGVFEQRLKGVANKRSTRSMNSTGSFTRDGPSGSSGTDLAMAEEETFYASPRLQQARRAVQNRQAEAARASAAYVASASQRIPPMGSPEPKIRGVQNGRIAGARDPTRVSRQADASGSRPRPLSMGEFGEAAAGGSFLDSLDAVDSLERAQPTGGIEARPTSIGSRVTDASSRPTSTSSSTQSHRFARLDALSRPMPPRAGHSYTKRGSFVSEEELTRRRDRAASIDSVAENQAAAANIGPGSGASGAVADGDLNLEDSDSDMEHEEGWVRRSHSYSSMATDARSGAANGSPHKSKSSLHRYQSGSSLNSASTTSTGREETDSPRRVDNFLGPARTRFSAYSPLSRGGVALPPVGEGDLVSSALDHDYEDDTTQDTTLQQQRQQQHHNGRGGAVADDQSDAYSFTYSEGSGIRSESRSSSVGPNGEERDANEYGDEYEDDEDDFVPRDPRRGTLGESPLTQAAQLASGVRGLSLQSPVNGSNSGSQRGGIPHSGSFGLSNGSASAYQSLGRGVVDIDDVDATFASSGPGDESGSYDARYDDEGDDYGADEGVEEGEEAEEYSTPTNDGYASSSGRFNGPTPTSTPGRARARPARRTFGQKFSDGEEDEDEDEGRDMYDEGAAIEDAQYHSRGVDAHSPSNAYTVQGNAKTVLLHPSTQGQDGRSRFDGAARHLIIPEEEEEEDRSVVGAPA